VENATGFVAGEFDVNRSLCELDLLAEKENWMAEPRDMISIRQGKWYFQPITEFIRSVTPETLLRYTANRVVSYKYIYWRILDWGCGMNHDVRNWLDRYAKGSMTYALRSGDQDYLKFVYMEQMQCEGARKVAVVAPAITADLDYAERLFGFNSAHELAVLVPFLCSRIAAGGSHVHDDIYFLFRAIASMMRFWTDGISLLETLMPDILALEERVKDLHNNPDCKEQSEYASLRADEYVFQTIADEAQTGFDAILKSWDTKQKEDTNYTRLWNLDTLNTVYMDLYHKSLFTHFAKNYVDIPKDIYEKSKTHPC
jgi:hypothetical protein